jgi:hypothetical protein
MNPLIALLILISTLTAMPGKPAYSWKMVAPPGSGCFEPNCAPGKFAMAIQPVTGFRGDLYLVGTDRVWISSDGVAWRSEQKTDWGDRFGQQNVWFRNKLWMIAGMRSWDDFRNDVWSSDDGRSWSQVASSAPWQARRGHGAAEFNGRLWVMGGSLSSGRKDQTPNRQLNDVWSSSNGITWESVTPNAAWGPREVGRVLIHNDRMWLLGTNDVWASADGKNWELMTDAPAYGTRTGFGSAVLDGMLWVYGGVDKNDVWYSADGKKWELAFRESPWSTRSTTYSVTYKNMLLLFSGKTGRADTQTGEIWAMTRSQ